MNSNREPHPQEPPAVDPFELINELDSTELTALHPILNGHWMVTARTERIRRERELKALRVYPPYVPEDLPYDEASGVEGYIAQIRHVNGTMQLKPIGAKELVIDSVFVKGLALRHCMDIDDLSKRDETQTEHFTKLFIANLQMLLVGPRAAALQSYESERSRTLESLFPEVLWVSSDNVQSSSRNARITIPQIQAAREVVEQLPYVMPAPDFFRLGNDVRAAVVANVAEECEALRELLGSYEPNILMYKTYREGTPLAFIGVDALRQAIVHRNPRLDPVKICKSFMLHPLNFAEVVSELNDSVAKKQSPVVSEQQKLTANQQELQKLLADPDINRAVLDLGLGDTVAVTEQDVPITGTGFDALVEKHLQLIGRAMFESLDDFRTRDGHLSSWANLDAGKTLRAGFYGSLRNFSITRLPVTEEELAAHFAGSQSGGSVTPETASRLVLTAELKSSGIKPRPVLLSVLVYVRTYSDKPALIYKSKRGVVSTGVEAVLALQKEAEAAGRAAERHWLIHSFRGLPGSKKRR